MNKMLSTLAILLIAVSASGESPLVIPTSKIEIPVNKETTFLTGPLLKDGTIDYLSAIREILGKDVTRENNAYLPILQISGLSDLKDEPGQKEYLIKNFGLTEGKDKWIRFTPAGGPLEDALFNCYKAPWTKEDHPEFAKWLVENDEALAAVTQAVQREHFMIPIWSASNRLAPTSLPALGRSRDYANALSERAMLRLGSNDFKGCREDLLTLQRIARLLSQGGSLPEKLVAASLETRAGQTATYAVQSGKVTPEFASAYAAQLDKLPELRPMHESVDLYERCSLLDEITSIARFGKDAERDLHLDPPIHDDDTDDENRLPFTDLELGTVDIPAVLKRINAIYDKMVAIMKIEGHAPRTAATKEFWTLVPDNTNITPDALAATKKKEMTKAFGDWILAKRISDPFRALELQERSRVRTDLARVALALIVYHADHNAYPETLAQLAPKYLANLPLDRFSGKPLLYKRIDAGFLLYSVGPDLVDDGGIPDARGKGDYVVTTSK